MKEYDIIIVGAGPSGISAAISALKAGVRVLLLDRADKIGKKILVTGNGKCNLSNEYQEIHCYRSDSPPRVAEIMDAFSQEKTMDFFKEVGILTRSKNGYIYPYNEQAACVRDAFESYLRSFDKLTMKLSTYVTELKAVKKGFCIKTEQGEYFGRSVIVSTGGLAAPKVGCDGSGLKMAGRLGHKMIKCYPALTPLKSSAPFLKKISGVRNQARIHLLADGRELAQEKGELQWTDYGISGVAIFQLSRYAILAMEQGQKVSLSLDFMPEWSMEELKTILSDYMNHLSYKTMEEFLQGFLSMKLIPVVLREARIEAHQKVYRINQEEFEHLCNALKAFTLRINGYLGYEKAQVTRGGVCLEELDQHLQSRHYPGLFFAGEVTDVDGTCGGYNLQWAFSSGNLAGQGAAQYILSKKGLEV